MPYPVLTIDGPSGAGKGTVATLMAQKLGWHFLDSGALYRLTALAAIKQKTDLNNTTAIALIARNLDVRFETQSGGSEIFLQDELVTLDIRTEEVAAVASKVAQIPEVREALLQRQRDFAQAPGLVADGRDMGTVVFPQAQLKVFLTASSSERANRRVKQLLSMGKDADYAAILADIEARDERDTNRSSSPLVPAIDALQIDSSDLPIDAVIAIIDAAFNKQTK